MMTGARQGATVDSKMREAASAWPDRLFIQCGRRRVSFAHAHGLIDRAAAYLRSRGVERGDRLGILMPNSAEFVLFFLACARLGVLAIPINTRYSPQEALDILGRSCLSFLIMIDRIDTVDHVQALQVGGKGFDPRVGRGAGGKNLPHLRETLIIEQAALAAEPLSFLPQTAEPETQEAAPVAADQPLVVVYTSGTSGLPKGVLHNHNILTNVANICRARHMDGDDRILGHMPFYHVAGLFAAVLPCLLLGSSVYLVARWDANEVAKLIEREKITIFGGIPTHFVDLVEAVEAKGFDTSSLKNSWIGGATLPTELVRRSKSVLGITSLQSIYGMTETTSVTTLSGYDDPIDVVCANKGLPIGDFEVSVRNPENGEALPHGEQGEVWVRGDLVMCGYLDDPKSTAESMVDDWFRSGDLGRFDDGGYLQITGRIKDVFRVGGSTVSPAEVERVIEGLEGVRQTVVVGAPDHRLGEVGYAYVQRREGCDVDEAAIAGLCRERLAGYKRPRFITFIDSFPMTATGKIQRQELARRATENLRTLESERQAS